MKQFIALFIFFIGTCSAFSQTVISSCSASDSIKALYLRDADRLALRKFYAQHLADTNNIIIPQAHADTILRALLAVYNATTLPSRNAVVSQYTIHTFPNPNMNSLYVAADSTLPWMQQLKSGTIPTGNTQVDTLISKYFLTLQSYNSYFGWLPYHVVAFRSDSNYNLPPLTVLFDTIPGVPYSEPGGTIGDGNDISASIYPTHVELIYSIGWGDCPSGCIYRHYWKFNVYYDCSVQFAGEYGVPIPPPPPVISYSGSNCINQTLTVTISGATSYSLNYVPISAAQFTLSSPTPTNYMVSAYNGTSLIMTSISITNCITSVNENKWNSIGLIYPNPFVSVLTIEFPDSYRDLNETMEIMVVDVLGKVLLSEKLQLKNSTTQLNVSALPSGMYYLKIGNNMRKCVKE